MTELPQFIAPPDTFGPRASFPLPGTVPEKAPDDGPDDPPPPRYVDDSGRTEAEEQHDQAAEDYITEQLADDMARADAPPMPAQAPPVPMFAGTYAIYDDGEGGVMLVVAQSTGEVVRKRIPAQMLKMAERFGGAGSGLAGLFGGA